MNEKLKNDRLPINPLSFFLLWVVLHLVIASIASNALTWLLYLLGTNVSQDNVWQFLLLQNLLSLFFDAPIEKLLMKWSFGYWIKGWIRSRYFSFLLQIIPYFLLNASQLLISNTSGNFLQLIFLSALFALPQALVLRPYVRNWWHYIVAAGLSTLLTIVLVYLLPSQSGTALIIMSISAAFMALTKLWLFRPKFGMRKAKRDEAESFQRLEDLAEEYTAEFEGEKKEREEAVGR